MAKDHERKRRAGAEVIDFKLTGNTPLPAQDALIKSTANKRQFFSLLSSFDFTRDHIFFTKPGNSIGDHEEVDITLISYMLQAAKSGAPSIRILSDETDVFVLLVYWVWKGGITTCVQMEKNVQNFVGHKCNSQHTRTKMRESPWYARYVRL